MKVISGIASMYVIVGLGNPGGSYENNRHNIGFKCVESIAHAHNFPAFKSKFNGLVSEHKIGDVKVFLAKPQTYMNLSANCVQPICAFYKISPQNIIVFHDDLDLGLGDVRIKKGGSSGGHNGLKSLDQALGNDYWRIRVGIGRPVHKGDVANYVLSDFAKADQDWINDLLKNLTDHIQTFWNDSPKALELILKPKKSQD